MLTLTVGKELDGRYVVQGSIGSGAYGTVWKAIDKQLNRNVALKRLLKDGSTTESEDLERLLDEARRHAQLVHTNIVQVFDVIECDSEHLIVMEYIDGPSLNELLRDQARANRLLPLDQAIAILKDALAGVAFAHDKGIIHRDLSPANILLTTTSICKIADFGIATEAGDSAHGGTGNPNFMAPEQQKGETADESSDLFMMGIIGYLLLTGRHPYSHPCGLFHIPELIKDDNFKPETPKALPEVSTSQQRLFREYSAVVMRLLNREKAGRFRNAREALSAIEAVTPFQECPGCGERLPEHFKFCGYCGSTMEIAQIQNPRNQSQSPAQEADELIHEGFELSRLRKWEDAISKYESALKIDPYNQKGLWNLGFALNRAGRSEEAENALTKGINLGFSQTTQAYGLLHERALSRAELKKYDEALSDVNKALDAVPGSLKSKYLRARIYLYREERENARRDASDVLRSIPDHAGALRLLDQLDK